MKEIELQLQFPELYKVAKNQRLLLRVIVLAVLGYVGLFAVDMTADREIVPIPEDHRDKFDSDTIEAHVYSFPQSVVVICIAVMFVFLAVAWLVAVLSLLAAFHWNPLLRILAILLSFVPVISLLVLLIVSSRATGALKRAGYKVGLLGVNAASLAELKTNAARA